jgi:hypothetical protein
MSKIIIKENKSIRIEILKFLLQSAQDCQKSFSGPVIRTFLSRMNRKLESVLSFNSGHKEAFYLIIHLLGWVNFEFFFQQISILP